MKKFGKKTPAHESPRKVPASRIPGLDRIDDIVDAIRLDHDDLRKFIEVMKDEDAELREKRSAYECFSSLLKSHSSSEEKALYDRCLKNPDLKVDAQEGYVEHQVATLLLGSVGKTKSRERWEAQVKVLAELVEHHLEEEESDFLPKVQEEFDEEKMTEMATEFVGLRRRSQRGFSPENAGVLDRIGQ